MGNAHQTVDILIVGNGALGVFLASELAGRKVGTVAVVGPAGRPGGASRAAGAMLGCFGEVTTTTLASQAGRRKFELSLDAHRRWSNVLEELSEESGPAVHVVPSTFLVLNSCGSDLDSANFDAIVDALKEHSVPWEEITPSDIPGYRPRPTSRALRALYLPTESAVDGTQILGLLEVRASRNGVKIFDDEITRLRLSKTGNAGEVELGTGVRISAQTVVVAAGAASHALVEQAAPEANLMPTLAGVGLAIVTRRAVGERFKSVVRTPNRAFACGLHVVPLGDGREYVGATNVVEQAPHTEAALGDLYFLLRCATQQMDERFFHHRVNEIRLGNRPIALDGFPLIGWVSEPNLFVLTGTYRDGFHCAPAIAKYVADEIIAGESALTGVYTPIRAPLTTRGVEASVDEYMTHSLAQWFESEADPPPHVSVQSMADGFRKEAQQFYERFSISYGLGPDVLWYLLRSMRTGHARRCVRYLQSLPG